MEGTCFCGPAGRLWGFLRSGRAGLWEGDSSRPPVTRAHWQGACCVRVPFISVGSLLVLGSNLLPCRGVCACGSVFSEPKRSLAERVPQEGGPRAESRGEAVLNSLPCQPAYRCCLWGNPLHPINGSPLIGQNESGGWRLDVSTLAF